MIGVYPASGQLRACFRWSDHQIAEHTRNNFNPSIAHQHYCRSEHVFAVPALSRARNVHNGCAPHSTEGAMRSVAEVCGGDRIGTRNATAWVDGAANA